MLFKAINHSIGFNGLVSTLLVFGAYSKMTEQDASFLSITERATAMLKVIDEVRKNIAFHQVNDVLNTCNGLSTKSVYDLPINSFILMY